MGDADLPPVLSPLAFLLGTWTGEGRGAYGTIDDFAYGEETTFAWPGKPVLTYAQQTWVPVGGRPAHAEVGYVRPTDDGGEFVLVQPGGVAEVCTGTITGPSRVEFTTLTVVTTPTAKPVHEVRRTYERRDDVLWYRLDMAAVQQPLGFHCEATLRRSG